MKLSHLFNPTKRRAARRAKAEAEAAARRAAEVQLELPPDLQGWQPGQVFREGDTTEDHRDRLIENILAENPGSELPLQMIREAIDAIPDPEERAHTHHHVVRLLQTYALVPEGPGALLDIAASPIIARPLRERKGWYINPIEILAFDYEKDPLPFDDASQEGVMLCEVMEHFVIDPLFCFNEINRVLKDGGFFVVTTPNVASWFSIYQALRQIHPNRWPVYAGAGHKEPNHIHAREYLVPEIRILLEAAGFEVEVLMTRDYGIAPEYAPLPGFPTEDRGETIFCRARKVGPPKMRYVTPIYLQEQPWAPTPEVRLARPEEGPITRLTEALSHLWDRLGPATRPAPLPQGTPAAQAPSPPLSARETKLLEALRADPPGEGA